MCEKYYTLSIPIGLPDKLTWALWIVDTFIHTVAQYVTYPVDARFQDRTAEGILQTLVEIGEDTIDNSEDYNARANLVWCGTMALNGLIGAGVPQDWETHMIGHELTAMFDLDHGLTLAILYPAVWKVRREQKKAKLIQYAQRVWGITDGSDDTRSCLKRVTDVLAQFSVKVTDVLAF